MFVKKGYKTLLVDLDKHLKKHPKSNTLDFYLDYSHNEIDSFAKICENKITKNKLYSSLNFNDTTSKNPGRQRLWSTFIYSTIVINKTHYQEIKFSACRNALITWSTEPYHFVCSFRVDSKSKTLKIFNSDSKKFLDFSQKDGEKYFEKCLNKLKRKI
jgi:hypothetical protein